MGPAGRAGSGRRAGGRGCYSSRMAERKTFTTDESRRVGEQIGIDWSSAPFDVEQFRMGMDVELEHGLHDLLT